MNLYGMTVSEPGNDLLSIFRVAAPDARKAIATLVESRLPNGSRIATLDRLTKELGVQNLEDSVLVWEEEHGTVGGSRIDIPIEKYRIGQVGEATLISTPDLIERIDAFTTERVIELGGKEGGEDIFEGDFEAFEEEGEIQLPVIEDDLID